MELEFLIQQEFLNRLVPQRLLFNIFSFRIPYHKYNVKLIFRMSTSYIDVFNGSNDLKIFVNLNS